MNSQAADVLSFPSAQRHGAPASSIVAVASGKGGVGKTWLSITLAHAWARQGARVLLCDGDLGLANVDVQLGIAAHGDIGAVLSGRMALAEAAARHPAGFDILAGSSGSGSLAALAPAAVDALLDGLHIVARQYDRVVLDLGAGLERGVRRMAVSADTLLVVVTDEPTSLTDAYAVLKLYSVDRREEGGIGAARAVVNQAASLGAGQRTYRTLAAACEKFLGAAPELAGVIRRDEQVRAAIRRQTPSLDYAPDSPAAVDVTALAAGF
jgi:flagellar biosynthesis protein FlhG